MSADEQALWDEATAQLGFHARPGHDWVDTLNRLWRKNRFVMSMDGVLKLDTVPPMLTRDLLTISDERWPIERLAPLVHPDAHARARPKRDDRPVLLLEWQSRYFLIDGINRINRRIRGQEPGPHAVVVIHVRI